MTTEKPKSLTDALRLFQMKVKAAPKEPPAAPAASDASDAAEAKEEKEEEEEEVSEEDAAAGLGALFG